MIRGALVALLLALTLSSCRVTGSSTDWGFGLTNVWEFEELWQRTDNVPEPPDVRQNP